MPKPASPITKLAAAMTPATAAHASVTPMGSVARCRGRTRPPPRIERRQVGARPHGEPRRTLLEERRDALASIVGASGPEHGLGIEAMRLHRMVGPEELPHHLPRQGHRDRRGVVADLAGQLPRRRLGPRRPRRDYS